MEKKMKTAAAICLAVMTGAMTLASCHEHEPYTEYVTLSTEVGSILCADGKTVPSPAYSPDMNGVGVIVKTGGEEDNYRFIAMYREDIGQYPYAEARNTEPYVDSGASTGLLTCDGKENTAAMMAGTVYKETRKETADSDGNALVSTEVTSLSYPAAMACVSHMTGTMPGWHLPSSGEWLAAILRSETVRRSIEKIGGRWLDESQWYQSSSQDGASGDTKDYYNTLVSPAGTVKSSLKTASAMVRPFITIR